MKKSFVETDNQLRRKKYFKNNSLEASNTRMNEILSEFEIYSRANINHPAIFVFGLPRSGTTLIYQTISYCLDIGYIDNIAARFWLAPLFGLSLSRSILGNQRDNSFSSDYGKSVHPAGPHEFAYFWQHWLKIRKIEDMIRFGKPNADINWNALKQIINSMQNFFKTGIVFKTNYVANYIEQFAATFSMPVFIYCRRYPEDVALSILKARNEYYGNNEAWWATYSEDYKKIKTKPYYVQIAGQVLGLQKTYERELLKVDDCSIEIEYQDFCNRPLLLLKNIQTLLQKLYGYKIAIKNKPSMQFKATILKTNLTKAEKTLITHLKKELQ